ncbi:MAG: methyltransferase family protein [Acidimicrobiales bacterium]
MPPRDPPYPELKKSHIPERVGRPWRDVRPPPAAPVWAVIQGYASYSALVAAVELGVFDALATAGPSTVEDLAPTLEASSPHLAALLDGLVALGLLEQVRGMYELNETAERYLTSDGPATMAALVGVANGPPSNWEQLAGTVRTGKPPAPVDDDPAAFYLPLVRATFPTQRRAADRTAGVLGLARAGRPLRVLDIGAGGAPWTVAFLTRCRDASAVVNDLPGVIGLAEDKLAEAELTARVELRPGDYHRIRWEPETYDLVVLGHVCRAEGDHGTRRLLARSWRALRPGGRVVVADYFPDNARKLNPFGILMGLTMAAATAQGRAFTPTEMRGLLAALGFDAIRLLEPIGFNQVFVATKPTEPAPGGHE